MSPSSIFWRIAERAILAPGARNGLSVLIFHRVRESRDPLRPNEPTSEEFDKLIAFVSRNFAVAPLHDAVVGRETSRAPYHTVAVTFDDGYADNVEVALPILKKHGVPATFFIASGLLDGGIMWNDKVIESIRAGKGRALDLQGLGLGQYPLETMVERRQSLRTLISELKYRPAAERFELAEAIAEHAGCGAIASPMMTREQLQELAGEPLTEVGGHTVTHPILKELSPEQAYEEIALGKESLEQCIAKPLRCFAYPNGIPDRDYGHEHVEMVKKAGFDLAVCTSPGGVRLQSDILQLPRFTPWDRQRLRFGLRMLSVARNVGRCAVPTRR